MHKYNTGKKYAVYLILAGLLVLALNFDIATGIDYGFGMGKNEGVEMYAATQIVSAFTGRYLHIDVFFDPAGYLLIIAGFVLIGKNMFSNRAVLMAVIGFVCKLAQLFLPLFVKAESLILPVIVMYLLQILAAVVIMYSLVGLCTKNIDNYKYMNIGRDLKFGAELYGVCMLVGKILYLLSRIDWYFAGVLYHIVDITGIAAVIYFACKLYAYMKQVEMFEEEK